MLLPRIIPCLLLKDKRLVKTVKFDEINYIGDPINTARIFNEMQADEIIFLDIFASLEERRPDFSYIEKFASECVVPVAYGGGIRDIEDVRVLFSIGIEKVVLNTYAYYRPDLIREIAERFGSQSVIVSVDVRKEGPAEYGTYILHGTRKIPLTPIAFSKRAEELGAGEIFLNCIDRDGTWEGYDLNLITQISKSVQVPVIVCGGAGSMEHLIDAINSGASAAAVGSMFVYYRKKQGVLINYIPKSSLKKAFL